MLRTPPLQVHTGRQRLKATRHAYLFSGSQANTKRSTLASSFQQQLWRLALWPACPQPFTHSPMPAMPPICQCTCVGQTQGAAEYSGVGLNREWSTSHLKGPPSSAGGVRNFLEGLSRCHVIHTGPDWPLHLIHHPPTHPPGGAHACWPLLPPWPW